MQEIDIFPARTCCLFLQNKSQRKRDLLNRRWLLCVIFANVRYPAPPGESGSRTVFPMCAGAPTLARRYPWHEMSDASDRRKVCKPDAGRQIDADLGDFRRPVCAGVLFALFAVLDSGLARDPRPDRLLLYRVVDARVSCTRCRLSMQDAMFAHCRHLCCCSAPV